MNKHLSKWFSLPEDNSLCRYPVGVEPPYKPCLEKTDGMHVYCKRHCELCYQPNSIKPINRIERLAEILK